MSDWSSFPYRSLPGLPQPMPRLPLQLAAGGQTVSCVGLLDSGAAANVLPFGMGRELGLEWNDSRPAIQLAGVLSGVKAQGVVLNAVVPGFEWVPLAFAWCESDSIPLILGQMNFFLEFDVLFRRADLTFDLRPRR